MKHTKYIIAIIFTLCAIRAHATMSCVRGLSVTVLSGATLHYGGTNYPAGTTLTNIMSWITDDVHYPKDMTVTRSCSSSHSDGLKFTLTCCTDVNCIGNDTQSEDYYETFKGCQESGNTYSEVGLTFNVTVSCDCNGGICILWRNPTHTDVCWPCFQ